MIASTQTPIFTAIEFHRHDDDIASMVTEPLLPHDEEAGNNATEKKVSQQEPNVSSFYFAIVGVFVGFIIQVVSLGAYSFMLLQYGSVDAVATSEKVSDGDWFIYSILSFLTQVDLVIYVMIWMAFTCTMTRNGMAFIRFQYQLPIKRRSVFVLGVYFLVGIVLGAFIAWTLIDLYLGFPIPFGPIATTVIVDLFLCYLMVWCYDLGRKEESVGADDDDGDDDDDDDDENAPVCC